MSPKFPLLLALAASMVACSSASSDSTSTDEAPIEAIAPLVEGTFRACMALQDGIMSADLGVSPNGEYLAYASCDGETDRRIVLREVATGRGVALDDAREIYRPRFTSDGAFVSYLSIERGGSRRTARIDIRSVDGKVHRTVPLFKITSEPDSADLPPRYNAPDKLQHREWLELQKLVSSFEVVISSDQKTAVVFGRELDRRTFAGRLMVAALDSEQQTDLSATAPPIGPHARVAFSPNGDRLLIASPYAWWVDTEDREPDGRDERLLEITLGPSPTASAPGWAYADRHGSGIFFLETFDGASMVRFDQHGPNEDLGHLVLTRASAAPIELPGPGALARGFTVHGGDLDKTVPAIRPASSAPNAPIVFFAPPTPDATTVSLFSWSRSAGTAPKELVKELPDDVRFAAFGPGGPSAYYSSRTGRIGVVAPSGDAATALQALPMPIVDVRGGDSGRLLARHREPGDHTVMAEHHLVSYDLTTGGATEIARPTTSALTPFGPTPAGRDTYECGYDLGRSAFLPAGRAALWIRGNVYGPSCGGGTTSGELWIASASGRSVVAHAGADLVDGAYTNIGDAQLVVLDKGTKALIVSGTNCAIKDLPQ